MQVSNRNVLIHILGCLTFLSLPVFFSPDISRGLYLFQIPGFQRSILSTIILLIFFYTNYYFLIPKFYINKKYIWYTLLVFICFLIIVFVPEFSIHHHQPNGHINRPIIQGPRPPGKPFVFLLNHSFFQFVGILAFSLMLKTRERLKQIETEKTNAELSYLKAQINPHFLFNTLNSIYSLAILKSEKTADALVKLSDMMRYVLNDGNSSFVSLEKEINYINNYIDLQKMRLSGTVTLNYKYIGVRTNKKVAPLILIPFIENAFKHGVSSEEESEIDIQITATETKLILHVKNKCVEVNNNTLNKSGLGIDNTKQRLSLLYPAQHVLKIDKLDNYFIVDLILNIHD